MGANTVTNLDMIEELFNFIKNPETSLDDVIKEHGGSSLYIPSYKTTSRNDDIIKAYLENPTVRKIKELAKTHNLSESQIYIITKSVREPQLF